MLFFSIGSFAQQRTITGTVTGNSDDLPMVGVNVLVQGTYTGTATDIEGHHSVDIPEGDVSIQFSFYGFSILVIPVGTSAVIDAGLEPRLTVLDEVVVTSLGLNREKKKITYSAQNVEMKNISLARELNVANLSGR